jgi:hypothetical protein
MTRLANQADCGADAAGIEWTVVFLSLVDPVQLM